MRKDQYSKKKKFFFPAWLMASVLFCLLLSGKVLTANANPLAQSADEGRQLFQQYCQACHTIGGGVLVGPDLEGVTTRRDLSWLKAFIANPDKVIASGDATAEELLAQYNNIPMPNFGLQDVQVEALLAFLESAAGATAIAPPDISGGDARQGEALFLGVLPLENGGIACHACHRVQDVTLLSGGTLGPDLTQVASRLGEPALASALVGLPFPTMRGAFANRPLTAAEQADLYAFFLEADKRPVSNAYQDQTWFWVAGGLGAILFFGLMTVLWPRRSKSISDKLRESL